jgi:hypothetical protein
MSRMRDEHDCRGGLWFGQGEPNLPMLALRLCRCTRRYQKIIARHGVRPPGPGHLSTSSGLFTNVSQSGTRIKSTFAQERNLILIDLSTQMVRKMGLSEPFSEDIALGETERPRCPRCQMRMITVLNPEPPRFECLRCSYSEPKQLTN